MVKKLTMNKCFLFLSLQQFGKILDVEIIFNERGSKVSSLSVLSVPGFFLVLFKIARNQKI